MHQHTVTQCESVVGVAIGQYDVDHEVQVPGPWPVDADGQAVEDLLRGQRT